MYEFGEFMNIPKILPLWINGEAIESEKTFDNLNPYTNELLCKVSVGNDFHIEKAIESAAKAQVEWANRHPKSRARILRNTAKLLKDKNDELAQIESQDTGKVIRETICVDIVSAVDCLEYIASLIETHSSRYIPLGQNAFSYTLNKPLGICLGIGAWNYPIQIATWKAAPALATGNAFIFKPSELTPITAYFLAEIFREAGLPNGLFQVIHGDGRIGKKLVEHKEIRKVSLTGSVETGIKIYESAAKGLKKISLELGGKGPLIICEDADIDGAVQAAMLANFYSQGEVCSNGTRVFVHKNIYDVFTNKLIEESKKIKMGNPLDKSVHMGPLISSAHKDKVNGFIKRAIADGADLLLGDDIEGNFISPTILGNCNDEMECVKEEIFGPVLSLLKFTDEEEVLTRANNTNFGLAGAVFSKDISKAHKIANELEVGVSWINAYNLTPVEMPFGGAKMSGLGMENGHEVLKEYYRTQSVYVNSGKSFDSFF